MEPKGFHRKLTAILSADVAGYSRLMQDDEAATVKTIESYKQVFFDLIKQHRGRVVDSPGDNLLAEFVSVVDAVQCAVAVQKEFHAHNAELPENRRMLFRIGVNLGDVIEEGERIYGDGVNIAARLESLADPGGICVSKTAFDQIETKLPFGYEFLGEQTVKNIIKPVGAYKVLMEPRVVVAGAKEKRSAVPVWLRKYALVGAMAVILVFAGAVIWNFFLRAPKIEPASPAKMAFPLPDKPSIAVLAFDNMSGDLKQEYFGDGIAEEIITALSKSNDLFVIARNSSFTYKGKPVKVQQVSKELGVRYVLEGSFKKSGERLRVTAQLIDAANGKHLWAERYDRKLADIFEIQDDITKRIIASLKVKLTMGELARVYSKGTNNLDAYLKVMQAWHYHMRFTKEDNYKSRVLAEEGIVMDPQYGQAYVLLAATYMLDSFLGDIESREQNFVKAIENSKKAIALDNVGGYAMLGWLYSLTGQDDKAIAECKKAVELDPNSAAYRAWYGAVLNKLGRYEEAVQELEQAVRRDPMAGTWVLRFLGSAYSSTERHEEAIATLKKASQKAPNDYLSRLLLTRAYVFAGRQEEAEAEAAEVLRINPKFSLEDEAKRMTGKDKERSLEALRRAGLK